MQASAAQPLDLIHADLLLKRDLESVMDKVKLARVGNANYVHILGRPMSKGLSPEAPNAHWMQASDLPCFKQGVASWLVI